jgi:hypothetical protein
MTLTMPLQITGHPQTGRPSLDIGDALDLLATAAHHPGRCIVEHALLSANVTVHELEAIRGHRLRDLYRADRLPIDLTLGALVVLDAAQRSEHRGLCGDDVLDDAAAAAARLLDLVAYVPQVNYQAHRCAGRCEMFARRGSGPGSEPAISARAPAKE